MQQPTSNRPQEIRLIKNIPTITVENTSKELASPTISKQIGSPSDLESPTTKKKRMLSLKKAADVQLARTELNNYIDILDTKVYKLVEKHEAQFLVAYRNHIKKVREEMEEIRNKALTNANSTVSQTEKIQTLQKQLTIFREESLKLFEKVNEKEGTIYNLKSKINELESEKSFLERSVRELVKRNKYLQGLNYESEVKKSVHESSASNFNEKQFFLSRPQPQDFQDFKNMYRLDINKAATTFTRSRPYTTAINSKGASIRSRNNSIQAYPLLKNMDFVDQRELIESKIDELLKNQVNQKILTNLKEQISRILTYPNDLGATSMAREINQRKQSVKKTKSFLESKTHAKTSQLEQYFCKSIEAVRKQITRRRGLKNMNFYSEYANLSLSQFKKVDFFRLLELLLSHDKIITALHRAIFEQKKQYL